MLSTHITDAFLKSICQMLGYACVAEYFSQPDTSIYLWLLSEELEKDTNALQALLGEGGTVRGVRMFLFCTVLMKGGAYCVIEN